MKTLKTGSWFDRLTLNPFTIKHHKKITILFYVVCGILIIIGGTGCEMKSPRERANEQIQMLKDSLNRLDIERNKARNTLCQWGFECTV